jgi:hypothetical protein
MPVGTYEVTLTATDSDGMVGTAALTIVVKERTAEANTNSLYLPYMVK